MWDDGFWDVRAGKKHPGKFLTYEEHGITLQRSAEFEDYLHKQKLSSSTIRTYPADVADFHGWIQDNYNSQLPRRLYREHVIKYRDYLVSRRVKAQTINHKLSALRKYNAYLMAHKHQQNEVFKRGDFLRVTLKKNKAFAISDTQISHFLNKIRKTGHARDIALVTLLAYTGMTLHEALNLSPSDFDWKEKQVTVHAGNKKKVRAIPLHEQAVEALQAYGAMHRTLNPKTSGGYFFPGNSGWKLNNSTINRLFNKHSKTITPKILRQCFQVNQLNQGATVAEVVRLTGADAQTISALVKRQADSSRKRINARQL